jgi:tetratricopeptide (TPR) repeat protein
MAQRSIEKQEWSKRPGSHKQTSSRWRPILLLSISLVSVGRWAHAASTSDDLVVSKRAEQELDLYGLRELAQPPQRPTVLSDETASRTLRAHILVLRATFDMLRNRLEPARTALEEALQLCPDNYGVQLALAEIDGRTLNEERALKACDRLIKERPTLMDAYDLKGRILEANGKVNEAIAAYAEALKHWPNCDSLIERELKLAFGRGDLDLTIDICKRRLKREPRHFYTLWLLGYVYGLKAQQKHDTDLFRESAAYYEKALEARANATKLYPRLAEVYENLSEHDKAVATLRRGIVADPADPDIRKAFERLVSRDGKDDEILAAYRSVAEEYPTSVEILGLYASQLTARQKFAEARQTLERLLTLEPNDVKTLLALGGLDLQMNDVKAARDHFERALRLGGEDIKTYETIGNLYLRTKQFDQAAAFFDKALVRDPKRVEIYFALAQAYQESKEIDKAIEVVQRGLAAAEQPKSRKPLLLAMSTLQQQKRQYGEAVDNLRKAYDLDQTDMITFLRLANLLMTVDDKTALDELLKQGRETFKNSKDEFQETLALMFMDFHRYAEAVPEFQALIERHRDRWPLYAHLASVYQRLHQSANSQRLFEEARDRLGSDSTDFWRFAARYYSGFYEPQKAHEALSKLLERLPAPHAKEAAAERIVLYGSVIFNLGRMKKYDEISKLLDRISRELGDLDPVEVKSLRARGLSEMKRYDEAAAIYRELIEDDPDNVQLQYELASVLNEAKKNDEAEKILRKCIERLSKVPTHPEDRELRATVLNHLGYMFAEQGKNLDEAERLLTEALDLQPRAGFIVDSMGWLKFQKGDTDQALDLLKKASDYSNEDPTIYDHLGDAYAKSGDREKAVECWRASLRLNPDQADVKAKIGKSPKGKR